MKISYSCLAGSFDFRLLFSVTKQDLSLPSYSTDLKSGFPRDSLLGESFSVVLCSLGRNYSDRNTSGSVKRDGVELYVRCMSPKVDFVEVHGGELIFCVDSA